MTLIREGIRSVAVRRKQRSFEMKKHTPKPWKWEREWKEDSMSSIYDGSMGCLEPDVLWFGMDGEEGIYCSLEANAKLIEAAPDLLHVAEMVRDAEIDNRSETGEKRIPDIAFNCIEDAIRKATGN